MVRTFCQLESTQADLVQPGSQLYRLGDQGPAREVGHHDGALCFFEGLQLQCGVIVRNRIREYAQHIGALGLQHQGNDIAQAELSIGINHADAVLVIAILRLFIGIAEWFTAPGLAGGDAADSAVVLSVGTAFNLEYNA